MYGNERQKNMVKKNRVSVSVAKRDTLIGFETDKQNLNYFRCLGNLGV